MFKRRLYLQIYATIFACLVAIVVISGILWSLIGRDSIDRDIFEATGKLAWLSLPAATAPVSEQQRALERLGTELDINITLFRPDRSVIGNHGDKIHKLRRNQHRSGWHRTRGGHGWALRLPDNRWLAVDLGDRKRRHPFLAAILYLGSIALVVFLVAYPLVRRLTRRLEKLNDGVERIGAGDLNARVDVGGTDEVGTLAKNFNEAAAQIQRLVDSNKMLLANASHELRTPLARIRLGVELLKERKSAERQASLESDINELDGLIDEILLMSRLDTKQSSVALESVDMLGLIAEECARYEDCSFSGEEATLLGDRRLLKRLVRNLLDNGQKHGGGNLEVGLKSEKNRLVFTVKDKGPGISSVEQEKIFEPFYRASTKQNIQGYGLGLSLVKQIADAHNAVVDVDSQIGSGTIVTVTFPIISDA